MFSLQQIVNGRYQLQQKLGERPARQTWLAQDLETKSLVVIKLLAFGGQVQWNELKLFEREAQILKELDHPFIPKYHDYFSIDERFLWFALVEQYIPGSSLQTLIDRGKRFTELEVKNIAIKLLDILSYLHWLNPQVLHRDIKPSNIIIGEDKQVYLVDFGSIQDKAAVEGASFTVVGTYGYTPMEQFGGRAVAASDLYALGATLIHLLTATPPADLPQKNLQIQFQEKLKISQHLTSWLAKITEPALENRFDDVIQAQKALKSPSNLTEEKEPDHLKKQQKLENEARQWFESGDKSNYLLSKKRLQQAQVWQQEQKDQYPLSKLAQNFIAESIKHQRNKRIDFLKLFLLIPLIVMGTAMVGYFGFREIRLNADKNCVYKGSCSDRIEALIRLVKAGKDLKSYNLSGADLYNANLSGVNLSSANLKYAYLYNANLYEVNLSGANLYDAYLHNANLGIADLQFAYLDSASLSGVNLSSANLKYAYLYNANLKYANLSGADLYDANLYDANLSGANLEGVSLIEVENLTSFQIKSACNWQKAFYKGNWNRKQHQWVVDEKANQQYIERLKQDKASDPQELVDCSKWK